MPILFFIDPEITKDKFIHDIEEIGLSYTFFKAKTNDDLGDGVTVDSLTQERIDKGIETNK